MNVRQLLPALLVSLAPPTFFAACGSGGSSIAGEVGTYEDGGLFSGDGDASGMRALDAYVEQDHVTVTFVTLSCSDACATVEAVGTGGYLPYTFRWDDGSTTATRQVCPTSSTNYSVKVADTGTSGEFPRAPETVQVPLAANVIACPDGGSADAGSGGLCLSNPSFEGAASFTTSFTAPPWANCAPPYADDVWILNASTPIAVPGGSQLPGLAATDGDTYLAVDSNAETVGFQAASEPLCAPLQAGVSYSLELDIASPTAGNPNLAPGALKIYGGTTSCSQAEVLWTSPVAGSTWGTFCATFTPTHETTYLSLQGASTASSYIYVDHLVPVAACP
jgi:hypothetical protein